MKLQEMSTRLIVWFIFKNSAKLSQNMWPREFDDIDKNSKLALLLSRSMHSLEPPLSSILFNFKFINLSDLLTLSA